MQPPNGGIEKIARRNLETFFQRTLPVVMFMVVNPQIHCSYWLILFVSLGAVVIQPVVSSARDDRRPMLAEVYEDYFLKGSRLKSRQQVRNMNAHHLQPGIRHITSGHLRRAIPELKFVLRYVPNHPGALQLMGVVARLTNQPVIAEQYFLQAIRVFPKYALTHAQFGKFLVDIGRVEDGIDQLEKAQSIQPDLKTVFVWLSEAYQKNGDREKAKMAKERAKELGKNKKVKKTP